jgi:hypothetical protein
MGDAQRLPEKSSGVTFVEEVSCGLDHVASSGAFGFVSFQDCLVEEVGTCRKSVVTE